MLPNLRNDPPSAASAGSSRKSRPGRPKTWGRDSCRGRSGRRDWRRRARLGRGLPGSTVYLAGEFKYLDKGKLAKTVEAAGARLVNGPFPGTDYYVHGDWCPVQTIAQLERQGARRLRSGDLEGL